MASASTFGTVWYSFARLGEPTSILLRIRVGLGGLLWLPMWLAALPN
jgi:hypothetical protein